MASRKQPDPKLLLSAVSHGFTSLVNDIEKMRREMTDMIVEQLGLCKECQGDGRAPNPQFMCCACDGTGKANR